MISKGNTLFVGISHMIEKLASLTKSQLATLSSMAIMLYLMCIQFLFGQDMIKRSHCYVWSMFVIEC